MILWLVVLGVVFYVFSYLLEGSRRDSCGSPRLLFFIIFWTLFCQFCFEVGRPGDQKTLKNFRFFSFFTISASLPTRSHIIDFLVNLAFNLAPKTSQKSTQEASKIDQKGYRRYDASWLGIWTPLGTDFGGFWRQVGRQVGPKLAPKSGKKGSQDDVKNMTQKWLEKIHARKKSMRETPPLVP